MEKILTSNESKLGKITIFISNSPTPTLNLTILTPEFAERLSGVLTGFYLSQGPFRESEDSLQFEIAYQQGTSDIKITGNLSDAIEMITWRNILPNTVATINNDADVMKIIQKSKTFRFSVEEEMSAQELIRSLSLLLLSESEDPTTTKKILLQNIQALDPNSRCVLDKNVKGNIVTAFNKLVSK